METSPLTKTLDISAMFDLSVLERPYVIKMQLLIGFGKKLLPLLLPNCLAHWYYYLGTLKVAFVKLGIRSSL